MIRSTLIIFGLAAALLLGAATGPAAAKRLEMDDWALSNRAAGLAMAGDIQGARRIAARIGRLDLRDAAFSRLAVILARADKGKAALVMLSRISSAGRRDETMVDMGIGLARRGRIREAETLAFNLDPWRRDVIRAVIAMIQAEQGAIRDGWSTARRTGDLPRRRDSLALFRGGLAKSLKPKAAIGAALGAETARGRTLSLLTVARGLVRAGNRRAAMLALSWARQEAIDNTDDDLRLETHVAADTAMILLEAGDVEGARQAALVVGNGTLRRFLLRHIDEVRMFIAE